MNFHALKIYYYEPVRLYLALGGVALLAVAIWLKLTRGGCIETAAPTGSVIAMTMTLP